MKPLNKLASPRWGAFAALLAAFALWSPGASWASPEKDSDGWEYYHLRLTDLDFEDPEAEIWAAGGGWDGDRWWNSTAIAPYFEATSDFEAFYIEPGDTIRIRLREGAKPAGVLVVDTEDNDRDYYRSRDAFFPMSRLAFTFDREADQVNERQDRLNDIVVPAKKHGQKTLREANYWAARARHFKAKLNGGDVGAPYFRHQAWRSEMAVRRALGLKTTSKNSDVNDGPRTNPARGAEQYDLFTGGRAIRENLQLDRGLQVRAGADSERVALDSIRGVTSEEMDWGEHLDKDADTKLDELAAWIPEDQHALFFTSFGAFARLVDESRANGTTALRLLESRSEDAGAQELYERQLALPMSELARKMGPMMVAEVAVTGSDPYLREGTDVAMLFLCKPNMASAVHQYILARHAQAAASFEGAAATSTYHDKIAITGVATPRREVSSYVANFNGVVAVSNSLAQLERCLSAYGGTVPSLDGSEDYLFFRQRYALDGEDAALAVLTDPTIRRWAGPRWRILEHRRATTGAYLNEIVAKALADRDPHAGSLEEGEFDPSTMPSPMGGAYRVPENGRPYNTAAGSADFLTPIIEIESDSATPSEVAGYEAFRDRYQNYWQRFFDPIGARVAVSPERLSIDTTIAPLIGGSDYNEFTTITAGPGLSAHAPPPSGTALLHFIMQMDPESRQLSEIRNLSKMFLVNAGPNPTKWIGRSFQVVVERDDEFWGEVAKLKDKRAMENFLEDNWWRVPIAAEIDSIDTISLTLFLAGLKSLIVSSAPGLVEYDNREFEGKPYVAMLPADPNIRRELDIPEEREVGIYYVAAPGYFFITINEKLAQDRIKRDLAQAERAKSGEASEGWAGENMALRVDGDFLPIGFAMFEQELLRTMRRRSYANILLMNEWKRLGADDPLAFHLEQWGTRLLCPAGGEYSWDAENNTMASSVLGSPVSPKEVHSWQPLPLVGAKRVDAGLTFEPDFDGLRARVEIQREAK